MRWKQAFSKLALDDLVSLTIGNEVKAVSSNGSLSVSQLLSRAWEPYAWALRL